MTVYSIFSFIFLKNISHRKKFQNYDVKMMCLIFIFSEEKKYQAKRKPQVTRQALFLGDDLYKEKMYFDSIFFLKIEIYF